MSEQFKLNWSAPKAQGPRGRQLIDRVLASRWNKHVGIERLLVFEHSEDDVDELAHEGADGLLGFFASCDKPRPERSEGLATTAH